LNVHSKRSRFAVSMSVNLLGYNVMKFAAWLEIHYTSIPHSRNAGGRYNSSSDNLKVKFDNQHIHTIFCFHLQGRTGGGSLPFNVVAVIRLQEITSQRTVTFITSNVCTIVIFTAFHKCFKTYYSFCLRIHKMASNQQYFGPSLYLFTILN
jgi:hypothetical protein